MKTDIKIYKPITPGLRHRIKVKESKLWKGKPFKSLTSGLTKTGGRNNHGRITTRHIGGGHKRLYRIIDFKRLNGLYTLNEVIRIEYDPNRSANIALCKTITKNSIPTRYFYIIASQDMNIGYQFPGRYLIIRNSEIILPKSGVSLPLKYIPVGSNIYNLEIQPGQGGKISRAAGTSSQLLENLQNNLSIVRLPSNKTITISSECLATVGVVGNVNHNKEVLGKAGRNRWLGHRPRVRGEAMNPIDHPHGGKSHGVGGLNTQPKTKWGKLAKWVKTSNSKRPKN